MLLRTVMVAVVNDLPPEGAATYEALAVGRDVLGRFLDVPPPPLHAWEEVGRYVEDLLCRRRQLGLDRDVMLATMDAAEGVAEQAPLAAVLPAMAVVADWEGQAQESIFRSREGARDWGWHGLVVPLARVLTSADLLWAGTDLVGQALETVRRAEALSQTWHTREALTELHRLSDLFERRYRRRRDELGWALAVACRTPDAAMRAPLAGLWWTLGEPWNAHALADGTLTPTPRQVRGLLDDVLRRAHGDPMVASVGSWVWRDTGFEPSSHESMRRRMTGWLGNNRMENVLRPMWGVSPSAAYGRAIVNWFAGRLTDAERETIATLAPHVELTDSIASVRFGALELLTRSQEGTATQDDWQLLASQAATFVAAERWYGVSDPYDRSLDLPLYYLDGGADELLAAVERQRRSASEFVLWNLPPPRPIHTHADALYDAEDILLADVRDLRFATQLRRLPAWAREIWQVLKAEDEDRFTRTWPDASQVEDELSRRLTRLRELAAQLEGLVPDYGRVRRTPPGTLRDFASNLEP